MSKKTIIIDVKTGKSVEEVKNLDNAIKDVGKSADKTKEASAEVGNAIDNVTGGAASKFSGLVSSIKKVTGGFNLMKIAIIGTGIGALLVGVLALKSAFTSSEAGQDRWSKIMTRIGTITGNLVDVLARLGEKIIWVFENPKQAIKDFAKTLKEQIVNRFTGMLELIPAVGRAVKLVFEGKFKEAGRVATNAMGKVALGVEDVTGKIKLAGDELRKWQLQVIEDDKKAQVIADKRAKATKLERELIVQTAAANLKRNELLLKAEEKDLYNKEQQKQFLIQASKIDEEITNKKLEQAQLLYDAQVLQNGLNDSTTEDLNAEAELQANLINLQNEKVSKAKEVTTKISAINLEAINKRNAENKAQEDKETKKVEESELKEEEKQTKIQAIRDKFRMANEDLLDVTEEQKVERQYERDLAELEALEATEEQKLELKKNYASRLETAKQSDSDESERVSEEKVKTQKELDDEELDSKMAMLDAVGSAMSAAGDLLGKETAAGKGLAVASSLINTYAAITKTLAAYPGPLGIAMSVATGLAGMASVKNILAVKVPNQPDTSSVNTNVNVPTSRPAQFNVVGTSQSNQLAQTLSNQPPIKTYVVSTEMSTQQEMDRTIEESAAFGS